MGRRCGGYIQMIDPKNLAIVPVDALGDYHIDKMVGKCPHCDAGLRAHGSWEAGVDITCTNFRCQAGWKAE